MIKKILISAVVVVALLAIAPPSNAAILNFQEWIDVNGEKGFTNAAPFMLPDSGLPDSGLILTATAFENPDMTTPSHVYMDGAVSNGITGGMGVCTTLTSSNQCTPSSDDNVSIDSTTTTEILSWGFNLNITELTLEMGDNDHFDFIMSDFQYSIDGGAIWETSKTNGSALARLSFLSSIDRIDFRAAGSNTSDHFYIRNARVTVVPVPAAVWLFGSGLIGLIGVARRKEN